MITDRFKHAAAFVRTLIAVGIAFSLINWDAEQVGAVMLAVEALGALIYASNNRNTATVVIEAPDEAV